MCLLPLERRTFAVAGPGYVIVGAYEHEGWLRHIKVPLSELPRWQNAEPRPPADS